MTNDLATLSGDLLIRPVSFRRRQDNLYTLLETFCDIADKTCIRAKARFFRRFFTV